MVIKSGESVVYLTRPQKSFHSSQPPKQHPELLTCNPDYTAQAHQNRRQYVLMPCRSGQSNELKLKKMKKSELKT